MDIDLDNSAGDSDKIEGFYSSMKVVADRAVREVERIAVERDSLQVRIGEMAAEIERLQAVIDEANAMPSVGIADFQYQPDGTAIVEVSLSKQGDLNPGDELFTRPVPAQQSDTTGVSVTSMVHAALDELGPYATALSENQWHRAMQAAKNANQLPGGVGAEFAGVLKLSQNTPVNFTVIQALSTLKTEVLGLESPGYAIQLIERIEAEQKSSAVAVPDFISPPFVDDYDVMQNEKGCFAFIGDCSRQKLIQVFSPNCTKEEAKELRTYILQKLNSSPMSVCQSPRITEQDADAIVNSAVNFMYETKSLHSIDYWLFEEGRALLNKLNNPSVGG